eukprot:TRINITY_DN9986_c0_g2_i1.p1 TRINITY_DN9986_c0_g2~~TRINITY_DN9986_c0_g2_i1.p1  ORF type:complete len:100 (-),score=7.44 TRINITY_DN9986_c0_g2_i1:2-301(-)
MKNKMTLINESNPKIDCKVLKELKSNLRPKIAHKNVENYASSSINRIHDDKDYTQSESSSDSDDYTLNTNRLKKIVLKENGKRIQRKEHCRELIHNSYL